MARPTESAKYHFNRAKHFASEAGGHYMIHKGREPASPTELGDRNLTRAVLELAEGFNSMSDGLRATYVLLDEVKGLLQKR